MKTSLAFVLLTLSFAACQPERIYYPTRSETLSDGAWKFTTSTLKYSDGTTDAGPLDDCKQDDLYLYEVNGDVTVTHGTTPCSADPANGKYASWELIDNDANLKEVYSRDMLGETAGATVIYHIDALDDHKLVTSRSVTESGKTFTEINTYTR